MAAAVPLSVLVSNHGRGGIYEQLFDAGPDAMVCVDAAGVIQLLNRTAERLFGYSRQEALGQDLGVLVPDAALLGDAASLESHPDTPGPQAMGPARHLTGRRGDGSEFPIEVSLSSTWTEAGPILTAAIRDVTEQHKVQRGQGRLAAIVESSEDAILSKTLDGLIMTWNRGAERLYGYRADEVVGRSVGILAPPGHTAEWQEILERIRRAEPVEHYETQRICKDGTIIDVSLSVSPIPDAAGNVVRASTIARDITARKETERQLQQAEERWRRAFDGAPVGMAEVSPEGCYVRVNPAFCALTGYGAAQLAEMTFRDIAAPSEEDEGAEPSHLEGILSEGHQERRMRHADGRELWLDIQTVCLPGPSGHADRFLAHYLDITAHKRQIQDLERRSREVQVLNGLGDLLSACVRPEEACEVVGGSGDLLFPGHSGMVTLVDPSRAQAEAIVTWGKAATGQRVFSPEACWALRLGHRHTSGGRSPRCPHLEGSGAAGCFCVPLTAMGETLGVFHVLSTAVGPQLVEDDLDATLQQLAVTVAERLAVTVARLALHEKLRHMSIRDPLTNLFNRRYMEETLSREIGHAEREHQQVGVIQIDIDHFNDFNNSHGHDAGDAVLEAVAEMFVGHFRQSDVACRYGGEEFTIILPGSSLEATKQRAEELRHMVAGIPVPYKGGALEPPTLSLGVAAYPEHGSTPRALVKAADTALYEAKAAGRNLVVVAT